MTYTSELQKFVTSQYLFSGARIALAIVIPSIILAHFGLLKEYFLFPLGTSFVGLSDQPGPFIRRRNTLITAIFSFFFVACIASIFKSFQILIYIEIIFFGVFFTMIGVYGQRLAAVGSLSLVVMGIFVDGGFTDAGIIHSMLTFLAGCIWFLVVFMVVSTIQPYKLAGQMIGENYLALADFLKIKARFYLPNPPYDSLMSQVIAQQIKVKNLQEDTRDTVFRTRKIVNESTTTSRLLMLMFLNSMDLHEKLLTSENDYKKIQEYFSNSGILETMHDYLLMLSDEIAGIGIAMQSGIKARSKSDLKRELNHVYDNYFAYRNKNLNSENLENFLVLRQILMRITEVTEEVSSIFRIESQNPKLAKSLSTGLDYKKFLTPEESLRPKVLLNNLSLRSSLFRHSIRITIALFLGYLISKLHFLGIGHSYWILITIVAIMKPAFSITKSRNLLRLYGTISGAVLAYILLYLIKDETALLFILLTSMILCFSFLRGRYFWAVLFMTIYIFLSFNFLKPGNVNLIFKDRILDTMIAGAISFLVSYFVFPVWEHTQALDLMRKTSRSSLNYFKTVIEEILSKKTDAEAYRLNRKEALINLANLSDNFQRMISDPKHQQKKLETVHQFVSTSHLLIAYTASFSQFTKDGAEYPEIDFESWKTKIISEMTRTIQILRGKKPDEALRGTYRIAPEDQVKNLLLQRKSEIDNNDFHDRRDTSKITRLTTLTNIVELLELIYDVAKEQRKVVEQYYATHPQS